MAKSALQLVAIAAATLASRPSGAASVAVGFEESAVVRRLPDGKMLVHLEFTNTAPASLLDPGTQHYGIFPSAVAEAMSRFSVSEFSLKLSQGLWDTNRWGFPMAAAPPGAELTAWVEGKTPGEISTRWGQFTNSASGLFCASLNQLDATKTVHPTVGFQRNGLERSNSNNNSNNNSTSRFHYGAMARESVCTENLTPWKKLLPCQTQAGIGQLLGDPKTLYGSHYHSLSTNARIICGGGGGGGEGGGEGECAAPLLQLVQSLSMVVGITVPIPDTVTLDSLMGSAITSRCTLASSSKIVVDVKSREGRTGLSPSPTKSVAKAFGGSSSSGGGGGATGKTQVKAAVYDLQVVSRLAPSSTKAFVLNLTSVVKDNSTSVTDAAPASSGSASAKGAQQQQAAYVAATRYATSNGRSWDAIVVEVTNYGKTATTVTIAQVIPAYLKVYISTLAVTTVSLTTAGVGGAEVLVSKFLPATSAQAPCFWELTVKLPAETETSVAVDFQRKFMGFMAYPPDPHKGFEVPSAIITATLETPARNSEGTAWTALILGATVASSGNAGVGEDDKSLAAFDASGPSNVRIYTEPLGVMMPSPDFSMPYNVISISSTVIAIAFASFLKMGSKLLVPDDEEKVVIPQPGKLSRLRAALFGVGAEGGAKETIE